MVKGRRLLHCGRNVRHQVWILFPERQRGSGIDIRTGLALRTTVREPLSQTSVDGAQHRIEKELRAAIDTLRSDMTRVELWASALVGFAKPVPGYEADEKFRLGGGPKTDRQNR
jgi:hypothetical protein